VAALRRTTRGWWPMPLPSSLESLRRKVPEGKRTEPRRWAEGGITARKYRIPLKKLSMHPRGAVGVVVGGLWTTSSHSPAHRGRSGSSPTPTPSAGDADVLRGSRCPDQGRPQTRGDVVKRPRLFPRLLLIGRQPALQTSPSRPSLTLLRHGQIPSNYTVGVAVINESNRTSQGNPWERRDVLTAYSS